MNMDDQNEVTNELLDEAYCELPLTGEYIETMCLNNGISNSSSVATSSAPDGFTMPITLVLPDSEADGNEGEDEILLTPDDLDIGKHASSGVVNRNREANSCKNSGLVIQSLKTAHRGLNSGHASEKMKQSSTDAKKVMFLSEAKKSNMGDKSADVASKKSASDAESLKHQLDLHTLETTTRLEDFMDVVTTYKCKFCRFSCPWRSGLMSHIRNCHIDAAKKTSGPETEVHNYALDPKSDTSQKKSKKLVQLEEHGYSQSPELGDDDDDDSRNPKPDPDVSHGSHGPTPPFEKHVFLCGECSEGFEFLEDCKNHMIKDHDLKLEGSPSKAKMIGMRRRRGRPRSRPLILRDSDNHMKDSGADDSKDSSCDGTSASPQKGSLQAAKDEYYLRSKRKRPHKETSLEKPFRCEELGCGYRFSQMAHLYYHTSCHSPYSEKSFICPECGENSENWRSLSVHLWKEHTVDVDLYTCEECGYKTYSMFKLDNHKKIHSDERNFICQTCNKGFKQLSQLRNHVVIHTDRKNMTEKRWYSEQKCEICNRTFSDSKCLKKHQQAVHSKLKPFVCTYCGHMSARKAMLQLHMRQHTGEKPFTCEHCEYRTGDHNSLRRHRMRHTGIKPYKCPHCPYACIQAISYKTHLKNKHPGLEGLYACSLCSFRSVSKDNFFNHMSDHRRGAIPGASETGGEGSGRVTTEIISQPTEMHLPDNTLQQLEGILPGNMTAAQLIYSCLNALSQENGSLDLPPGVTTASMSDGTQTITIQIPSSQEANSEQYFLTVENEAAASAEHAHPTKEHSENSSVSPESEILHPITVIREEGPENQTLDSGAYADQHNGNSSEQSSLVIAHVESSAMFTSSENSSISDMVHCDV